MLDQDQVAVAVQLVAGIGDRAGFDRRDRRFNNLVPRHFDGGHLTLPSTSRAIRFYDHQKRVIWRVIAAGSTYIAHAVGAGKTYSIADALMEQKRLGLIAKPLLVVACLVAAP